jgi:hypothetical protein
VRNSQRGETGIECLIGLQSEIVGAYHRADLEAALDCSQVRLRKNKGVTEMVRRLNFTGAWRIL